MTRFCFITCLILAFMSCNKATDTTIGVHFEGIPGNVEPKIITNDTTYTVVLDSTKTAKIVLAKTEKPGYAQMKIGRMSLPLYIEPGKSFEMTLKAEGRKITPEFTGEGAKKNEYLNSKVFHSFRPDFKADEKAFIASLDEQVKTWNANLDTMGFDPQFNQLEKKRLHAMAYSALPMYSSYHGYYAQLQDFKPSADYYEALKAAAIEEDALLNVPEYQELLTGYVSLYPVKDQTDYDAYVYTKAQLDYANKNIKSPVIASYLINDLATSYVGRNGVTHLAEIEPIYNAKVINAEDKAAFKKLCDKWAKIAKGQPSPSFKYMDINGKEVSLKDLAGKYVYVDVWATWCGPCCGEIPHLQKLEHQFKNKNIHFVSISCDRDKSAWEKKVKEEKLGGIQLHYGNSQDFMNAYMVTGIPRFILLDREGKILEANMSRPSNPKTAETLKALPGM